MEVDRPLSNRMTDKRKLIKNHEASVESIEPAEEADTAEEGKQIDFLPCTSTRTNQEIKLLIDTVA